MDSQRFSAIAHGALPFWNPIDPARLDRWIDDLDLAPGARALDIGCGPGELLLRLVTRHGCGAVGVDPHAAAIARGRQRFAAALPDADVRLIEAAFDAGDWASQRFDLIACLGSSHAVGGLEPLAAFAAAHLRPGGRLLVAEGFWASEPDPAYLEGLGGSRDDLLDHTGNQALLERHGLALRRVHATTPDEWARYEDSYRDNIRAHLAAHPDDPDAAAMDARITTWRTLYERWGRTTLGFGLYLVERRA